MAKSLHPATWSPALSTALVLAALLAAAPAGAEEDSDRALVGASQNPASDLTHIRIGQELRLGEGLRERNGWATVFTPSFPTALVEDAWNLVHRFHVGMVWQPEVLARSGGYFAMSDIGYDLFLAPARIGNLDWGLGLTVLIPTGTDDHVGEHMWVSGPAAALRWASGAFSAALTARQQWAWASTGSYPRVKRLLLEPSLTWMLPAGFHLQTAPAVTFDERTSNWIFPLGGGVGRLFSPGGQKVLVELQAYRWGVARSDPAAQWTIQLGTSLLFPR